MRRSAIAQTIDMTPTWADIVPLLLEVMERGNATGRAEARAEIMRMATIADAYVAEHKGNDNAKA